MEVIKAKIMAIIKKTFVENPLDILKILIPTLLLVLVVIAVITVLITDEQTVMRNRTGSVQMGVAGFIFMLFGAAAVVSGILFLVLSLMKKRTVVCDPEGCQIDGVNFWENKAKTENFLWTEIKDTNLTLDPMGEAGEQLTFRITANGVQTRVLPLMIFNRRDFDDLIETFNQSTAHLPHEWVKSKDRGNRQIIEEVQKYSKVARR
ncbi:MAG: hypothetical protein ABI954_05510 [Pyrinomonadaceae bacterium]